MKKLALSVFTVILLSISSAFANGGIGITLSYNDISTDAKEDVDNNSTTDATKNVSDKITAASIFAEYTYEVNGMMLTMGVDVIPVSADIDKRTTTQSSIGAKAAAGTPTTGTNSVEASISDHITFYIQPGVQMTENTIFYGTLGYATADVEGKSNSLSSTNITEGKDLAGVKLGIGVKWDRGDYFMKFDYAQTDYNQVGWTTDNGTKGMADLDNKAVSVSMGKSF